jgi:glycosyltransferase involved in cell wall biosynthesis
MPAVAFVVPGPLDTATGGSIYDRRIVFGLRERGWNVGVVELEGEFPRPSADAVARARRALAALPDGTIVLADGLAFGALPDVVIDESQRLRFVPVIHLPLALDVGLAPDVALALERGERVALAAASAIVVTGAGTRDTLVHYGVERDRIHVVPPGTDPAPLARGSSGRGIEVLCVATVNRGKGHAALIDALAAVPEVEWHLTCVGSLTRDHAAADELRSMIQRHALAARVALSGELRGADLSARYQESDVFALATRRETYGMAVAEALAHGLPVVSTRTGAIPELVGDEAGVLVAPEDGAAFALALGHVLRDADLRRRLAAGARAARSRLATWDAAFDTIARVLDQLNA